MSLLRPVQLAQVELTGGLLWDRLCTVVERSIPSQYEMMRDSGILESLDVYAPIPPLRIPRQGNFTPQIFWDSDVGKWIESASYALSFRRDSAIEARIDQLVDALEKAQDPDGYLNCWFLAREPDRRFTNLRDNHELYCSGHLLEGAIAYFQATGRRKMLDMMERYVAHIDQTFGAEEGKKRGYPGHQELELALLRLYRLTQQPRHLALAKYFTLERGRAPHYFEIEARSRGEDPDSFWAGTYEFCQAHAPVAKQDKLVGHAVRALYMACALADLVRETGDENLHATLNALWQNATEARMYVTGGLGSSQHNEGFTSDYDLPNDTSYAETCAAVAMVFWAHRMLQLQVRGQYADVMELALYNGALVGLSLDGERYFYSNKLESDGSVERWKWHICPCCTMNITRLLASVGSYFYSTRENSIFVHLYGASRTKLELSRSSLTLTQTTDYPWNGSIELVLELERSTELSLHLRVPGWATGVSCLVNGEVFDPTDRTTDGYMEITRVWNSGDRVELELSMETARISAHPAVIANRGRVAVRRGPLIYCLEQHDQPDVPFDQLRLDSDAPFEVRRSEDLLDGVTTLHTPELTFIPYYAWCNRGPAAMQVWIRK